MSIRITNDKNKRIIIIKNKNDMNNLDPSVSHMDTDPAHWDLFGGFGLDRNNPVDHISNDDHPEPIDDTNFNSQYNLDSFDDDESDHYVAVSAYPAEDEFESMLGNKDIINTPILRLKDPTVPVSQTTDLSQQGQDTDDFGADFDDMKFDDNENSDETAGNDTNDQEENTEQSNYQGMIRTVRGAYLVFKRKQSNDTYEEVWMYNIGKNLKEETNIRKAILAGTDVDPNTHMSNNGEQKARTWTVGNVQFLTLTGLNQ